MDPRKKRRLTGRIVGGSLLAGVAVLIGIGFVPKPVPVVLGKAAQQPLDVTVDGSGKTRLRARYTVSAPLFGSLERSRLRPGDPVAAGSVVARIAPAVASLLDPRSRAEATGRVAAAQANQARSEASVKRAEAGLTLAREQEARLRALRQQSGASQQALDQAEFELRAAEQDLSSAKFARRAAQNELDVARATLASAGLDAPHEGAVDVLAPVAGSVLRVLVESEAVVQPGSALLEIGDPDDLEVVVDLLTTEAVSVQKGAEASIDRWGGPASLRAVVREKEPSAFTTHSALGVEEQRVWVVLDLVDPPEARRGLSDGYRVEAHIRTLHRERALVVPASALFRDGSGFACFVAADGVAQKRTVTVGVRTPDWAEITAGVTAGSHVILYPSDQVRDGVRVAER